MRATGLQINAKTQGVSVGGRPMREAREKGNVRGWFTMPFSLKTLDGTAAEAGENPVEAGEKGFRRRRMLESVHTIQPSVAARLDERRTACPCKPESS